MTQLQDEDLSSDERFALETALDELAERSGLQREELAGFIITCIEMSEQEDDGQTQTAAGSFAAPNLTAEERRASLRERRKELKRRKKSNRQR